MLVCILVLEICDLKYMKNRFFLLLSVIFAFLQGPFLPPVFVEGILFVLLISADSERISTDKLLTLFVGGLIFDLVQGQVLGVTPLIFGVSALGLTLLKENVLSKSPWILGAVALITDLSRSEIVFGEFLWVSAIICALLTFLLFRTLWPPANTSLQLR